MRLPLLSLALLLAASPGLAADRAGSATEAACSPDGVLLCVEGTVEVAMACAPLGDGAAACDAEVAFIASGGSALPAAAPGSVRRFAEATLTLCYPNGLCMTTISTLADAFCGFGPTAATCTTTTPFTDGSGPVAVPAGQCLEAEMEGYQLATARLTPGASSSLGLDPAVVTVAASAARYCA